MTRSRFYSADLAHVHHAGFSQFARAAAPGLVRRLRAAGIRDGLIVDLGCGSGVLARELVRRGYDVLGVDRSPAMIRLARRLAPRARFRSSALADGDLPSCRAIFALGEVLGYGAPGSPHRPGLAPALRRLARALQPNGLIGFDLIVSGRKHPMDYRRWDAGRDWAVLVEVSEDLAARTVRRDITIFRRIGRTYRRSQETHFVGVYDPADVVRAGRAAGLAIEVAPTYDGVRMPPGRAVFYGRKEK